MNNLTCKDLCIDYGIPRKKKINRFVIYRFPSIAIKSNNQVVG